MSRIIKIKERIFVVRLGHIFTNCYILRCSEGRAVVIDPGDELAVISEVLDDLGLIPRAVIVTHGHFDHVGAVSRFVNKYKVPLYMHELDIPLAQAASAFSEYLCEPYEVIYPDIYLHDGDAVIFDDITLTVIHAPGHSPGSVILAGEGVLFVGDVIFANGGYGRTDFPGGSYELLMDSIKNKVFSFPDDMIICPGHGDISTVKREKLFFNEI